MFRKAARYRKKYQNKLAKNIKAGKVKQKHFEISYYIRKENNFYVKKTDKINKYGDI